jgi:hypothetical protein
MKHENLSKNALVNSVSDWPPLNDQSEPSSPFEPGNRHNGAQQDYREAEGVSPLPRQFGHELEVHAIDAGDQRRRDADDRDDRKHLEEIILLGIRAPLKSYGSPAGRRGRPIALGPTNT